MPADLTTGILIDEQGAHRDSTAILRLLPHLGPVYWVLGWMALVLVPKFVRDFAYRTFARNRGTIWKQVKKITGMGDTMMDNYREKVLGLDEHVETKFPGWGFTKASSSAAAATATAKPGPNTIDEKRL
uniref:Uncharacterized protein n=1 Tax=Entomoneis paludosa TaxID=265537 RepID=A0A7S2YGA7_9STRA|mmetsp:Transcript_31895/g.66567  ORF Transcript_31895/g.66567 Transcript_31895/m.66567 type:complete len:129 (+) Transcript_31895:291-677(+)|eukprot:CAMPEP_0172456954 /NCGR_PEP_ID=MMETSP1065-20121228/18620_1 /TAXON_ID=265537 /ORGANISM="Amphiprora paludosa, Strain CCMP125" /LENGTH=128 /DNA_ID=CAMNT_0013210301 /DNA_START=232 /DNA_END=618 /DNA_ORIENTATION=-